MPGRSRHRSQLIRTAVLAAAALVGGAAPAFAAPTPAPTAPAGPAAPAGAAASAAPDAGVPGLDWADCGDGFQCATAVVPLDHARPRGETIELALIRKPAVDPARRIGTLFTNPGGPGGSGVDFVRTTPPAALAAVTADFDFVGWDPRGVGASTRVECGQGPDFVSGLPRPGRFDPADWIRASREYGAGCLATSGRLLRHVSTADTARDLDLLRRAVKDEKLSYLGFSYGTLIGSTYASLFPGRTRAMVLDAAIDPDGWLNRPLEARQEQVSSFEQSLGRFFTACARDQLACSGFGGADPADAFDALVTRLDRQPVPAGAGMPALDGDGVLDAADDIVYRKGLWSYFAAGLAAAQAGDGSLLQALNASGSGIDGDATTAIRGTDQAYPRRPGPVLAAGRRSAGLFPRFGWLSGAIELPEALYPAEAAQPFRGPFRNPAGAVPILVIGGTHDPATPYVWSQRLVAQLGNARLLTYAADGHVALTSLNSCAIGAAFTYLTGGPLPPAGTVCVQDTPFVPYRPAARAAAPEWGVEVGLR